MNITQLCKKIQSVLEENISSIPGGSTCKEKGHSDASVVEEWVAKCLSENGLTITHELKNGEKMARSLSDHLVNGKYANVKYGTLGEKGKGGQPNVCSLKRLYQRVVSGEIDAYLIIWIKGGKVKVFDVLSNLKYICYNDGPGQCMLKESKFISDIDGIEPYSSDVSMREKVSSMMELIEKGYEATRTKREKDIKKLRKLKVNW